MASKLRQSWARTFTTHNTLERTEKSGRCVHESQTFALFCFRICLPHTHFAPKSQPDEPGDRTDGRSITSRTRPQVAEFMYFYLQTYWRYAHFVLLLNCRLLNAETRRTDDLISNRRAPKPQTAMQLSFQVRLRSQIYLFLS